MSKQFAIATITPAMLAAILATAPAFATTTGSDRRLAATESRDARQESRIIDGIATGSINANEAARFNNQQTRVDNSQARLAADGHFSRRDYARVDYRQDRANRSIARARNNRR